MKLCHGRCCDWSLFFFWKEKKTTVKLGHDRRDCDGWSQIEVWRTAVGGHALCVCVCVCLCVCACACVCVCVMSDDPFIVLTESKFTR